MFLSTTSKSLENVFIERFMFISWWILFPAICLSVIISRLYFLQNKKIFIKNEILRVLYAHKTSWHNCIFVICVMLFVINTCTLLSSWINVYFWKNIEEINRIWSFTQTNSKHDPSTYFIQMITFGYILHFLNTSLYIWYNVHKTDSFFSKKDWIKTCKSCISKLTHTHIYWEATYKWNVIFNKIKELLK